MKELDHLLIDLSGTNLIEASAGTGKTYAITSLYLRLVLEAGLNPEQILVVTYTEAATKELRGRIRTRLRDALAVLDGMITDDVFLMRLFSQEEQSGNRSVWRKRLEQVLGLFDTAAIYTIHAFCMRALQENAFESGASFECELVVDQNKLIQEIADDFWRSHFFGSYAELLQHALRLGYSPAALAEFAASMVGKGTFSVKPHFVDSELQNLDKNCREVFRQFSLLWVQHRNEVCELLQVHKALSRSVDNYKLELLPLLLEQMDAYCLGDQPYALFDDFNKFCRSWIVKGTKKTSSPPSHTVFDHCQKLYDLISHRFLGLKFEFLQYCRDELASRKQKKSILFFDDLLSELHAGICGRNGEYLVAALRTKYRAVMIDEFQDTDPLQYDIFRRIYAETDFPLFLIGDPKQAIYSFRGADIFAYMRAADDVEENRKYTLISNWRSDSNLLHAFNRLFSAERKPFVFEEIEYHPVHSGKKKEQDDTDIVNAVNAPLQLWLVPPGDDGKPIGVSDANMIISERVAGEISKLLCDMKACPADIAVIVRSHRQGVYVRNALSELAIPTVMRSDKSVFASNEARELYTVILALSDPGNETYVRNAMITDLLGYNADDLSRILSDSGDEWEKLLERFCTCHKEWQEKGFMNAIRLLMLQEGVRGHLLGYKDGERRLTNLLHCCDLIHDMEQTGRPGVSGVVSWFCDRISLMERDEAYQIRLETDEHAVKILTVHISKGLEYPIVFCPFLWVGIRDYDNVISYHEKYDMVKDFGSGEYQQMRKYARKELLAESLRLLYVAVTRAKHRCYIVTGNIVDKSFDKKKQSRPETSPLSYLLRANAETRGAEDVVEALARQVIPLSAAEIEEELKRLLCNDSSIAVVQMPDEQIPAQISIPSAEPEKLTCRAFERSLSTDWRVTSFSGLSSHDSLPLEVSEHDEPSAGMVPAPLSDEISIYTFPRGAQAGVCLHEIFEELDFTQPDPGHIEPLVTLTLKKYGYAEYWVPVVVTMVHNVITAKLDSTAGSFSLSSLEKSKWISEMEFFFPLNFLTSERMSAVLKKYTEGTGEIDFNRISKTLRFKPVRGMLRGFIDMVFEVDGKYYLLDWKSNHLGSRSEDYSGEKLIQAMEQNLYPLQYLIYTVALDRYLSHRITGYNYTTHFGGVLYVFIRGVKAECGEKYGFFRDAPSAELIAELTDCLIDCGGQ